MRKLRPGDKVKIIDLPKREAMIEDVTKQAALSFSARSHYGSYLTVKESRVGISGDWYITTIETPRALWYSSYIDYKVEDEQSDFDLSSDEEFRAFILNRKVSNVTNSTF